MVRLARRDECAEWVITTRAGCPPGLPHRTSRAAPAAAVLALADPGSVRGVAAPAVGLATAPMRPCARLKVAWCSRVGNPAKMFTAVRFLGFVCCPPPPVAPAAAPVAAYDAAPQPALYGAPPPDEAAPRLAPPPAYTVCAGGGGGAVVLNTPFLPDMQPYTVLERGMTQPAPPALARPPQPRREARAPATAAATATPQALVPGRPLRTNAARLLLALLAERHLKPCAWVAMHRPPPLCYAYAATLCRAGRDRVAKVSPGRWRHAPPMSVCTRQVARAHVFGRRGAPLRHTWGCARVRRACVFNWAVVLRWCPRRRRAS